MSYKRKTRDEFNIEQFMFGQWEIVNCELTRSDANRSRKEYQLNQPEYPVRIRKVRVKI